MASQINASNSGFGGIVSTGDSSGVLQLQAAGTTIATIQSTGLNLGSNGVVFSDSSSQTAAASPYVLKNRIINGAMVIDQRNAGASVSISGLVNTYTLDRWVIRNDTEAVVSVQQSSTAPTGFNNSLLYTVTTADTSLGATQNHSVQQRIEGFNFADLGWGTANAKTITISFWVRSSLTGTFGGAISNSAADRSYPFTYTISAANTWEYETITIAGDTTGTWLTTNGVGAYLYFSTGAGTTVSGTAGAWAAADYRSATGAVSVVGTNGATFYITGVQLEQNTSATPFERRLYGQELLLCQRYYEKSYDYSVVPGTASSASSCVVMHSAQSTANQGLKFQVVKRATPTLTGYSYTSGTINNWTVASVGDGAVTFGNIGLTGWRFTQVVGSSGTFNWAEGHYTASAEL